MKNYIWGIEIDGAFVMSTTTRASARWVARARKEIAISRKEEPKKSKIVKYYRDEREELEE